MRLARLLICSLLIAQLSGCGFHLRGYNSAANTEHLPLRVEHGHSENSLRQQINQHLNMLGIVNNDTSMLRLQISGIERSDRVLSLDADVRTAERQLMLSAELSLSHDNTDTSESLTLQEQRILFTDADNPVGNSTEQSILIDEMEAALSRRIAQQAARWLDRENANAAATRPAR